MLTQFKANVRDATFFLGEAIIPKDMRNSGVLGSLRRQVIYWSRDSFVLSYPKCGRTWLRTMIGRVIDLHHGLDLRNPMEVQHFWKLSPKIPCIGFSHDDGPNLIVREALQVHELDQRRRILLGGAVAIGRQPPLPDQLFAAVQREHRVGVPDVDGEKHGSVP